MKTNYLPALITLLAGAVYCLIGIREGTPLMDFCMNLLIVLLIFFVLGSIIRFLLDKFMGEIETKETEEEEEVSGETASEAEAVSEDTKDEE